jgi:hypothetical protein
MNKPFVSITLCISLFGCLVLGTCIYYTWRFGGGDAEIGNFNRYVYTTRVDPMNKSIDRSWAERPTTERPLSTFVNMWAVGAMFIVAGPTITALEYALRDNRHF